MNAAAPLIQNSSNESDLRVKNKKRTGETVLSHELLQPRLLVPILICYVFEAVVIAAIFMNCFVTCLSLQSIFFYYFLDLDI